MDSESPHSSVDERLGDETLVPVLYAWHQSATRTLVSTFVQKVRASTSSLLYNVDYLASRGAESNDEARAELLAATNSLNLLVNRLLDFERLGEKATEGTSALHIVRLALKVAGRTHDERRISLVDGDTADVLVHTNALLTVGILSELLCRAISSGPHARASLQLGLRGAPRPTHVSFTIESEGAESNGARRERSFEFSRHDTPGASLLGLAIARETARRLGGDLFFAEDSNAIVLTLPSSSHWEGGK